MHIENSRAARAVLIGAGRAGGSLAHAWHTAGVLRFSGVFARSGQAVLADRLKCPVFDDYTALPDADVWIIATPDDTLTGVAQALAGSGAVQAGSCAFHLSGAMSSEVLSPLRQRGLALASAHPVRSFPKIDSNLQLHGSYCGIEGDRDVVARVREWFEFIGATCFEIDTDAKTAYHCAAVLANNALFALADTALEAWQAAGLDKTLALALFSDLCSGAVRNVNRMGVRGAITGPLARGDVEVVKAQLAELDARDPEGAAIYRALSRRLLSLVSDRLDAVDARDIAQALDEPST